MPAIFTALKIYIQGGTYYCKRSRLTILYGTNRFTKTIISNFKTILNLFIALVKGIGMENKSFFQELIIFYYIFHFFNFVSSVLQNFSTFFSNSKTRRTIALSEPSLFKILRAIFLITNALVT